MSGPRPLASLPALRPPRALGAQGFALSSPAPSVRGVGSSAAGGTDAAGSLEFDPLSVEPGRTGMSPQRQRSPQRGAGGGGGGEASAGEMSPNSRRRALLFEPRSAARESSPPRSAGQLARGLAGVGVLTLPAPMPGDTVVEADYCESGRT